MEVIRSLNAILFSRSFPISFLREYFNNTSNVFNIDDCNVIIEEDERVPSFVKVIEISSEGKKSQETFEKLLRWMSLKTRLDEFVWAYHVEFTSKLEKSYPLSVPSTLPLVGNLMLKGIILSNVKDLDMHQREFSIVQIDNELKVIKRTKKYIGLSKIEKEAENLINIVFNGETSIPN
ncbi:hypothetical protein CM19_10960 [Candidatus Acidianus copahuensis]|uniref:Uncharacterized protein n=1 Tax=Candidatus Acidianus copahuensis TaxID=1160895 RepID=A0A031LLK3_9CREN|nr:hypothetical protein [Candidatus Acidianus copahuensis]EZQ02114.1 hypothetical protein CM19_10960 [Candidatus Acidianus copahuensis]